MKKRLVLILTLFAMPALAACDENGDLPVTAEPQKTYNQLTTQEVAPETLPAPTPTDSISDEEFVIQISVATDEILSNFDYFHKLDYSEVRAARDGSADGLTGGIDLVIWANQKLSSFSVLLLGNDFINDELFFIPIDRFGFTPELETNQAFILSNYWGLGTMPWSGVSFTDIYGQVRYFTLQQSQYDGSWHLNEFVNRTHELPEDWQPWWSRTDGDVAETPAAPLPALTAEIGIASAHARLFADVLSDFFVNIASPPYWAVSAHSTQAIIVDVDGYGTPGMIASKWSADRQHYLPYSTGTEPVFVQRFFYIYDNQLYYDDFIGNTLAVTAPARRLIAMSMADAQGISLRAYTLLGIADGNIHGIKSIAVTDYWGIEGYGVAPPENWDGQSFYHLSYHSGSFWDRDWEQDITVTHAQFDEIMTRYGLYNTIYSVWELQTDDTDAIMSMAQLCLSAH